MSDARALPRNQAPARCCYCGVTFAPPGPDTPMCRDCYFSGAHHAERLAGFLRTVRKVAGDLPVEVEFTGGGCWWIACRIPIPGTRDERIVAFTMAYRDRATGEWDTDATLPDTSEGPWSAGHMVMFEDSTCEGIGDACPLTPAQCAVFLRAAIHDYTPEEAV